MRILPLVGCPSRCVGLKYQLMMKTGSMPTVMECSACISRESDFIMEIGILLLNVWESGWLPPWWQFRWQSSRDSFFLWGQKWKLFLKKLFWSSTWQRCLFHYILQRKRMTEMVMAGIWKSHDVAEAIVCDILYIGKRLSELCELSEINKKQKKHWQFLFAVIR